MTKEADTAENIRVAGKALGIAFWLMVALSALPAVRGEWEIVDNACCWRS